MSVVAFIFILTRCGMKLIAFTVQTLFNEMFTYPCIMCKENMSILSDLLMTQEPGMTSVQLLARVPASVWCTGWWGTSSTSRRGRGRVKCSTTTCGAMTSRKYL